MPVTGTGAQVAGTGTVVSIGGPTGETDTYVAIAGITDFKLSGRKTATTSVTTFGSAGAARKLGTITDYGQATFTTIRISNDPGQVAVIAANATAGLYDFEVQLPKNTAAGQTTTGDLIKFSGIVTDAGDFEASLTKQSEYTFTIDIDGAYVTTEGA
jgi:hypothetical protein